MSAYQVSLENRRFVLLAVMSLVASLLVVAVGAPAAQADDETVSFDLAGPTNVTEAAGTVDLDITVTSTGSFVGPVTFDIATSGSATLGGGADYTLSQTSFSFAVAETQTLTVTINDDGIYETTEDIVLSITNILPGTASGGTNTSHTINVSDNDALPSISIDSPAAVDEGNAITFTVTRSGASEVAITFDATTSDNTATSGDYSDAFTNPLTIPGGATDNVTFDVNATSDNLYEGGGAESFDVLIDNITGASGGTTTSSGTINDTDAMPTLAISDETSVDETGSLTFTVSRTGADTVSDITFDYTTANDTATAGEDYTATSGTNGVIPAAGGTFDIIVPLTDDDIDEGANETFDVSVTVTSGNANNPAADGVGTITEDDAAGVTISETSVAATEGGTATYTVELDSEPTDDVTITLSADNAEATAEKTAGGGAVLTFTPLTWGDAQEVTVTAVDDDIDEDDEDGNISHTAASTDGNYVGDVGDVAVDVTDNDTAGVTVSKSSVSVTEGGSGDSYTITLDSEPVATVTIDLSLINGGEFSTSTGSVVFLPAEWEDLKPVDVTADDDTIADGTTSGTIDHSVTSTDPKYPGSMSVSSVGVTIIDDETPNISVVGTPTATEGGANGTYDVVLTEVPTDDVTVTLTKTGAASEFTIVSTTTLTFTTSDWDDPQTVTVAAVDDDVIDGDIMGEITHSASGGGYDSVVDQTVEVTVADDDVAGVTITEPGGSTDVIEGGTADTYRVQLDAEPAANVTVTVTFDSSQLSVTPASLTFTPANWDVFQEFSVTGVSDSIDEADVHTVSIQHGVTTTDTDFELITIDPVVVNITDADVLVVSIDGPAKGAPGLEGTFTATVNSGGTGTISYEWLVFFNGNPLAITSPNSPTFAFTPTEGGTYFVQALISDDKGQTPTDFVTFTVLGDIAGHTFISEIVWLAEEGITKGCNPPTNDEFCPDDYVTRGQMAAFLVRFLGLTDPGAGDLFDDDDGLIFENDIDKLATAGITRGCNPPTNTNFCPGDRVTRGQMAAFLVRALNLTDPGAGDLFDDDDGLIFENDIDKLATAGITRGCNPPDNTNFCPHTYVTRGQMAAFLKRASSLVP